LFSTKIGSKGNKQNEKLKKEFEEKEKELKKYLIISFIT